MSDQKSNLVHKMKNEKWKQIFVFSFFGIFLQIKRKMKVDFRFLYFFFANKMKNEKYFLFFLG